MTTDAALTPPRLPRPAPRPRLVRVLGVAVAVLIVTGWAAWYAMAPDDLPTSDATASASGVAGSPVYVGMFTAPASFDRELAVSGVKVRTRASAEVTVTPFLCVGASIGVTTAPERFCEQLLDPEGQTLSRGDSILLEVEADAASVATIDRIHIAYREGLRWSTEPAGLSGADVTIVAR